MPRVELKGISRMFGRVVAVDSVDLTVKDGEYLTVLGPSGCGKTTLIKIIAGILEPTEGEVLIEGRNMESVPTEERDIGYVFQNIALFPHLNVKGNVSYGPLVKAADAVERERISERYLSLVRLLDRMDMFPGELAGGEQQKVSLARALASGARLLLLDEPLSALDARVRVDLRYELRKLVKELGLTTIHVTHDQEEALSVSDRIVLMRGGSIVESNPPEIIYRRPQHLFTANFVGETNLLEGRVVEAGEDEITIALRDGSEVKLDGDRCGEGDAVVICVRPANVFPHPDGFHAVVTSRVFMGTYWRIGAKTDSDENIEFDVPLTHHRPLYKGEEVNLTLNREAAIVFPRPPEGILEAIRLE